MHILFVHQNFPAQFGHIAAYLVREHGFQCSLVSEKPPGNEGGIRRLQVQIKGGATKNTHDCSRSFENFIWHSHAVYECLKATPDVRPEGGDLVGFKCLDRLVPMHQSLYHGGSSNISLE